MKEFIRRFIISFFFTIGIVMAVLCAFGCLFCLLEGGTIFYVVIYGLGIAFGVGIISAISPYLFHF